MFEFQAALFEDFRECALRKFFMPGYDSFEHLLANTLLKGHMAALLAQFDESSPLQRE